MGKPETQKEKARKIQEEFDIHCEFDEEEDYFFMKYNGRGMIVGRSFGGFKETLPSLNGLKGFAKRLKEEVHDA